MIVYVLMMISFIKLSTASPEHNADPVGQTTTKGCYSGGWTLYSLKSLSGKSLDHSVSLRSGYLVQSGFRV